MTLNHPFFTRWPAQYPDRLQLFSAPTPNGVKVGIMLEETSLAYEPHRIDILADESHDPAFLALNPNGKIPAIYDPDGPSGTPLALFESGAILLYLADKTGQFISADPNTRYETIQWVMWQMGGVGPMFGQVGFFNKFAGKAYEDKRPRGRARRNAPNKSLEPTPSIHAIRHMPCLHVPLIRSSVSVYFGIHVWTLNSMNRPGFQPNQRAPL